MKAQPGDKLIISGHQLGERKRIGRITDVRGDEGGPPYRVQWDDTGHTTLLFPGPDCTIEQLGENSEPEAAVR